MQTHASQCSTNVGTSRLAVLQMAVLFILTVFLLASALSPEYDLSKALGHVRGKVYVFTSPGDSLVLGTGTRLFGTIDGIKSDAAGLNGLRLRRERQPGR